MTSRNLRLAVLFSLSALAAAFKIVGGIVYGSKSLLVDALTSIANLVALTATITYFMRSLRPPDEDHHYGHRRLTYGGTILTLMSYSFVAGIAVAELMSPKPYSVSINAPILAVLGFATYSVVIVLSRRWGKAFLPYSVFTVSELIESGVVIASSVAGALYSYIIDYAGAWILAAYIFYELALITRDVIRVVSDTAPPQSTMRGIARALKNLGLEPVRIRLRMVDDATLHGDVIVRVPPGTRVDEVNDLISEAERVIKERFNADVTIALEATNRGGREGKEA